MLVWELYAIFALGLLSSLHCVSMCGPIVLSYSLPLGDRRFGEQALAHIFYNLGRILTYSLLGAAAGLLGGTFGLLGQLAGLQDAAAIVAGLFMLAAGLLMLDLIPSNRLQKYNPLLYTSRFLKPLGGRIASSSPGSKFSLGLMLGFLPCGLVYAALFRSVSTGTIVAGSITMMVFGLGTSASLLAIGLFSTRLSFRLSRWGSRLAAASVLLLGLFIFSRGLLPMIGTGHKTDSDTTGTEATAHHH